MNHSSLFRPLFVPLALGLLWSFGSLGCATPSPSAVGLTAASEAAAQAPGAHEVAPSAEWLSAMDRGPESFVPGMLEVRPAAGSRGETGAVGDARETFLELSSLEVDVEVVGAMARYEGEHVFHNPGDEVLEGTFRFPLPHGAIVTGLAMEIDGKLENGEILERERAREIYEEIVDSMRDPALLEWEAGQTFKLRVFPINPDERKRVVMRYLAPLVPDDAADSGLAVAIPSATPAMQDAIPSLRVRVDGEEVLRASDHGVREALRVPLAEAAVANFAQELHGGQRYLSARVDLDWSSVPEPGPEQATTPSKTLIVVDSSRSALESWGLARESVATVLEGLGPDTEFMVLAADLDAIPFREGFVANNPGSRAEVQAFLQGIEPDGASDLGRALTRVGEALAGVDDAQVIYIGDGTPTWGLDDDQALVRHGADALDDTPLYALSVGKRESRELLERLTGQVGGRTVRPQTLTQVEAFSGFLAQAPGARRLSEVEVQLPGLAEGKTVHAPSSRTWFEGERPSLVFALDADEPVPERLVVRGRAGGRPFEQVIALGAPQTLAGVRQQWASRELATTSDKAAAVALSVEHSVLSKHTALLVLESEEAYERYDIERRNGPKSDADGEGDDGDPRISGRDLDGGDASPYLGPGDLQPGDPEIYIPAPRDAVSVEVVFPFGETKAARWEQELGQWTVRFLVDDDTESGTYAVLVRVTHADGRVELLELEYTIDVAAPQLRLELRPRDDGAYDVYAEQVLSEADAARERHEGRRDAAVEAQTLDARRVELVMPDGQTLTLRRGLPGQFIRRWEPQVDLGGLAWPATVTAVVADRALNSRRVELELVAPADLGGSQ